METVKELASKILSMRKDGSTKNDPKILSAEIAFLRTLETECSLEDLAELCNHQHILKNIKGSLKVSTLLLTSQQNLLTVLKAAIQNSTSGDDVRIVQELSSVYATLESAGECVHDEKLFDGGSSDCSADISNLPLL